MESLLPGCEPGWGSMLSSVVSQVSQLLPAPARPSPLAPLLKPSPPSSDDSDQHSRYRYSKIVIKSPKIIFMYKGLIFSVVGCQRKRHGSFWRNAVRTTSHFKVHTLSTHVIFFVKLEKSFISRSGSGSMSGCHSPGCLSQLSSLHPPCLCGD